MILFIIGLTLTTAINLVVILRQKTARKRLLMLVFMLFCSLLGVFLSREGLPANGTPRRYYESPK